MNKETETPDVANEQSTEVDTRSDIERELERVESIEVELRGDGVGVQPDEGGAKAALEPVEAASPPVIEEKTVNRKEVIMDQMRNNMTNSSAKPKKLSAGIAVLTVLVIALMGVVGWLVFDKMRVDSELASAQQSISAKDGQISSLTAKSGTQSADAKEAAKPSAQVADGVYRTIPEWGVRYKVADIEKDKDVTYALSISNEGSELLGVRSVATARTVKNPGVYTDTTYPCGNPEQAFGHIVRMSASEHSKSMQEFNAGGNPLSNVGDAKKVGDYYYIYRRAQAVNCVMTSPPSQAFKEHIEKWQSYGKYIEDSVIKKLESTK